MGRLDRARAAAGRRDPQRAARVASERGRRHPGGERRRAPSARAAGDQMQRPWVADLIGRPAGGELVGVRVSEQNHPLRAQALPRGAVGAGDVAFEQPARRGHRQAGDPVEILHADRDAAQQRRRVPFGGAALIGARCLLARDLGIQASPRVDRVGGAVDRGRAAVPRLDPAQARVGQLDRRQAPGAKQRRGLEHAQVGGVSVLRNRRAGGDRLGHAGNATAPSPLSESEQRRKRARGNRSCAARSAQRARASGRAHGTAARCPGRAHPPRHRPARVTSRQAPRRPGR